MKINSSFEFNDEGFKKLQRNLENLREKEGVPLSELFPDDFIRQNTDFTTFQAMVDASGINNPDELDSEEFSKFVSAHSKFENLTEMNQEALGVYVKRKLGL